MPGVGCGAETIQLPDECGYRFHPERVDEVGYNRNDLTKRYRTVPDWIYYFLVLPLLALLPPGWGYRLVCRHARHFYRGQVEARERSIENLEKILGPQLPASPQALTRRWFELIAADDLDGYYFPFLNSRNLSRYVSFEGLKHLEEARSRGRGVVLLTAHLGAPVTAMVALGLRGFPHHVVANDARIDATHEPAVRAYSRWRVAWMRKSIAGRIVFLDLRGSVGVSGEAGLEIYRLLQQGEMLTILIDVPPDLSQNTARVRFLDRWCDFPSGAVRFAAWSSSPIVPFFILRSESQPHRQRIVIEEPIETTGEVQVDLQRCVDRLDRRVRAHPAHWVPWDSWSLFEREEAERELLV